MAPDPTPTEPQTGPESPHRSRSIGVVALALIGLALTAGITYAASTVVSQPIGLTSEPATVGDSLAPGAPVATTTTTTPTVTTAPTTTVTTTVTTATPPPAVTVTTPPPVTTTSPSGGEHDDDGDDD